MNTSFNQGELLFPHPYRLEVSVGKDFQLLLKMSPCLLGTPIAVNTWQKEPQNNYCKLPPARLRKKIFFTGKNRSSGLKWQENVSFSNSLPRKILFYHYSIWQPLLYKWIELHFKMIWQFVYGNTSHFQGDWNVGNAMCGRGSLTLGVSTWVLRN